MKQKAIEGIKAITIMLVVIVIVGLLNTLLGEPYASATTKASIKCSTHYSVVASCHADKPNKKTIEKQMKRAKTLERVAKKKAKIKAKKLALAKQRKEERQKAQQKKTADVYHSRATLEAERRGLVVIDGMLCWADTREEVEGSNDYAPYEEFYYIDDNNGKMPKVTREMREATSLFYDNEIGKQLHDKWCNVKH